MELEFGVLFFYRGRKNGEPGEKPFEQGKNQLQTQPTYGIKPESNPGHIGGRRVLSTLHVPVPHKSSKLIHRPSQLIHIKNRPILIY